MNEKINIKQIAELAGVSVATVSRVINQNGRFSPETEKRVRKIIEQYHYVPDAVAKGLRTSRMQAVGVIVPDIVNNHFARLVLELEKALVAQGYSTVFCNTDESEELEEKHIQALLAQRVVGIILISGTRHYDVGRNIPVIYLDRRPAQYDGESTSVVIESDNENGGYLAARCLLSRGCRNIAVLMAAGLDYNHKARFNGYQKALREAGIEPDPSLVLDIGRVSYDSAREAVKRAVERGLRFDGILCTADDLAIGAVIGLKEQNRRVPDDVLVTGFDDSSITAVYDPSISSVRQDVKEMAACAVEVLLDMLQGKARERRYYKLPVQLVERDSTKREAER